MVADMTTAGSLRGYVGYNDDTIKAMQCAETKPEGGAYDGFHLSHLTGKGYLAFTVDQGEFMERYQGIVALSGDTITQSVQHYFNQSEQIGACLKVAVSYTPANGWRAGGIMLQRMPDASITATDQETVVPFKPELIDAQEEDWARANILLQSITDAELVQPDLHSHDILLRLFHEEGVRIFETSPVINQCRCSTERVAKVLATLSEDDRTHAAENGIIKMTCEFCSQKYHFDAETLSCIDVTPPQTTH
jgi:molecular chaperone Hsp33